MLCSWRQSVVYRGVPCLPPLSDPGGPWPPAGRWDGFARTRSARGARRISPLSRHRNDRTTYIERPRPDGRGHAHLSRVVRTCRGVHRAHYPMPRIRPDLDPRACPAGASGSARPWRSPHRTSQRPATHESPPIASYGLTSITTYQQRAATATVEAGPHPCASQHSHHSVRAQHRVPSPSFAYHCSLSLRFLSANPHPHARHES